MEAERLRYIIFLLDTKTSQHDGKIFTRLADAREYAEDCITEKYADKIAIGMFYIDQTAREMNITFVETVGFAGDKKKVSQLELFQPTRSVM